MGLPGNNMRDNRFMSTDPAVSGAYWREEAISLQSRVTELEAELRSILAVSERYSSPVINLITDAARRALRSR